MVINSRDLEGLNISAECVNWIKNTEENLRRKMNGNLPVGKPKDGWIDAWTRGAIKLLGTAAWKRLAGDWKICGCNTEEARPKIGLPLQCDGNSIVWPFRSKEYCQ